MSENFRRVELSSGDAGPISMPTPRGINKGNLTLWVTAGVAVLSVTSTILGFYKWRQGEEALAKASTIKADAETAKLQFDRAVSAIDAKYADALKRFELNLMQKDTDLRVQQLRTELTAQEKNRREAELAAAKTRVETVNAVVATEVVEPMIPLLHESTSCSVGRDPAQCGIGYLVGLPPAVPGGYLPGYPTRSSDGPRNAFDRPTSGPRNIFDTLPSPAPSDPHATRPLSREAFLPLRR